jgi:DNA polymerase
MEDKEARIKKLKDIVSECNACPLHTSILNHVFGEGSLKSKIIFIAEGPGREEDEQGRPFVGRCGRLLRDMIRAIGLDPINCYLANAVKCRPPSNRAPETAEIDACSKFLFKQIEIISPRLLVLLGRTAVRAILPDRGFDRLDTLRTASKVLGSLKFNDIDVLISYHPSALLRDPSRKICAKEDFLFIKTLITDLYLKDNYGRFTGNEPAEQFPGTGRVGVHGREGRDPQGKAYRLSSLFSEEESVPSGKACD